MRQRRLKLSAVLLLGLGLIGLQAQETIPATGGIASGSGGSVSYSVGQVIYTTNTGTSGSVAQGVQQPYEISVVTGIEEAIGINVSVSVSVYPNPVTEFLKLKVESYKVEDLSYQLYDMNGRLLENKKITGSETSIAMSNHSPAIYFLKITEANKEVKTFKIIKTH